MQRILYRTPTPEALEALFGDRPEEALECELPMGEAAEPVTDGAWVLAVFETSTSSSDNPPVSIAPPFEGGPISTRSPASSRATVAPARVMTRADGELVLRFSTPDWQRIASYARIRRESAAPRYSDFTSERSGTTRPVSMPSIFPAVPLPQVETMCIVHWFSDPTVATDLAEALGAPCHGFEDREGLTHFAADQVAAGQRLDAFVLGLPADDDLGALVKDLRDAHPAAVVLCLVSGARAQIMRALYQAGADEVLQAQTSPAEVAVTLLALVRRRAAKGTDALGAA